MSISLSPWKAFTNSLMTDFQTQYGNQSDVLNYLTGILKPMVQAGGLGFSAPALAAMRTGASDTVATQYQNAEKALQQRQAINGDASLPSGVAEQAKEQLAAAGANTNSTAQNNITLANEQERENNLKFATSALSGVASEENPLGFASAAEGAGGTEANLENANTNASANSFTGSLTRSLGSGIGSFLTGTAPTEIGKGGLAALYGG